MTMRRISGALTRIELPGWRGCLGGWLQLAALVLIGAFGVHSAEGVLAFKTLASFNGLNGAHPIDALAPGTNGILFGVTTAGGSNNHHGIMFRFHALTMTSTSWAIKSPLVTRSLHACSQA